MSPLECAHISNRDPDVVRIEESDLQFVLCLITSKHVEVQDYVLNYMALYLHRYLGRCFLILLNIYTNL